MSASDYVLEKLDDLTESIRQGDQEREDIAKSLRELERFVRDETWEDERGDMYGMLVGTRDKVEAIADHLGLDFDYNPEKERLEIIEGEKSA